MFLSNHPSVGGVRHKLHKKIAKKLFPNVDPKIIDRINKLLDNPPLGPEPNPKIGRVPGLRYTPHRGFRHNLIGAIIAGYEIGGIDGAIAAAAHLGVDLSRDQVVKAFGSEVANIVESVINIALGMLEKKMGKT
jgi:hypothetical protein